MIFEGTIVAMMPAYGVALVIDNNGVKAKHRYFMGVLPVNGGNHGFSSLHGMCAGQCVLCYTESVSWTRCFILCSINTAPGIVKGNHVSRAFYDFDNQYATRDAISEMFRKNLIEGMFYQRRDYGNGISDDAYPGDIELAANNGTTGLRISELVSCLRASPLAMLDLTAINNRVRALGETVEADTLSVEAAANSDLAVFNMAYSPREAMGSVTRYAMSVEESETRGKHLEPYNMEEASEGAMHRITALPLYRLQSVSGASLYGGEQSVVLPKPSGSRVQKHSAANEPLTLSRVRRGMDGSLRADSVDGIISVKSPVIVAAQQTAYDSGDTQATESDSLRKVNENSASQAVKFESEATGGIPEGMKAVRSARILEADMDSGSEMSDDMLDRSVGDAVLMRLADLITSEAYLPKFIERLSKLGLGIASRDASVKGRLMKRAFKAEATDKPEYDLPESAFIEDRAAGVRKRIFNSTSFISQEPDGSISICDGYGSEIRMSRGNIYISPALDLHILSGRDVDVKAGRHQSYNSQETLTINASSDASICSYGVLKVAGGVGERRLRDKGSAAAAGGLVLDSSGDVTVCADGLMTLVSRSDMRLFPGTRTTGEKTAGNLNINADAGSVNITAKHMRALSADISVTAAEGTAGQAAFIGITPNTLLALTQSTVLTGNLRVTRNIDKSSMDTYDILRGAGEYRTFALSASRVKSAGMVVDGSVLCGEGIVVNGAASFTGALSAQSVAAVSQPSGGVSPQSLIKVTNDIRDRLLKPVEVGDAVDSLSGGSMFATHVKSVCAAVDTLVSEGRFSFPSYSGMSNGGITVRSMAWQGMKQLAGDTGKVWHEQGILVKGGSYSMPYPGTAVWDGAKLSASGLLVDGDLKLSENYIINAKDTEKAK